jgi:hypothetical protein
MLVIIAVLFVGFVTPAQADTVYSDFGPTPTALYQACLSLSNCAVNGAPYQAIAVPFTPDGNFQLTQIDAAINYYYGSGTNDAAFDLSLYSDSNGQPGTIPIMSWLETDQEVPICCGLVTQIVSGINVLDGNQYWIVVTPTNAATLDLWQVAVYPAGDNYLVGTCLSGMYPPCQKTGWSTGAFFDQPAFDVLGTAVPEPSSPVQLGFGLLVIAFFRNRSHSLAR